MPVYKDTPQNRKLKRVGKKYGYKSQEEADPPKKLVPLSKMGQPRTPRKLLLARPKTPPKTPRKPAEGIPPELKLNQRELKNLKELKRKIEIKFLGHNKPSDGFIRHLDPVRQGLPTLREGYTQTHLLGKDQWEKTLGPVYDKWQEIINDFKKEGTKLLKKNNDKGPYNRFNYKSFDEKYAKKQFIVKQELLKRVDILIDRQERRINKIKQTK